jgi:Rps23 Pro-64 3,4-dihydroxylase Tpa1-like proline 4-hydroxylase
MLTRKKIADIIVRRIETEQTKLTHQYDQSKNDIGYFYLDDVLPEHIATEIYEKFPAPASMKLKKSLREYKYIAAQMNEYERILEECVYAFQDPRVVQLVARICGLKSAYPDVHLYAGGISMMGQGQFLNPHVDNSHDKDRCRWRVLNLLYYVSPSWDEAKGGNLELWPRGIDGLPITISNRFNRLVVMATHGGSWHSVSPISSNALRCCVSNYYFADEPLKATDEFHVTSFRARPGQVVRDIILRIDAFTRKSIRKVIPNGVVQQEHVYKQPRK